MLGVLGVRLEGRRGFWVRACFMVVLAAVAEFGKNAAWAAPAGVLLQSLRGLAARSSALRRFAEEMKGDGAHCSCCTQLLTAHDQPGAPCHTSATHVRLIWRTVS